MLKKILILFIFFSLSLISQAQGLWTQKASLPDTARGYGIGFSIGNYGYVGLGYNSSLNKTFTDFWQFNPSTNAWVKKVTFPGKIRVCPATFVIGHKAYVVTGTDSAFNSLNECWVYDADANTWTQKNDFPGPARAYDIGFAIGNKGFIGTGYDIASLTFYKDIWEYDTTDDSWTRKNDFSTVREGASAFAVGNKGYLCFGEDTTVGWTRDMWQYDTTTDAWTQKSSYPSGVGLYAVCGFVLTNNIFVGNGQDSGGTCHTSFWMYNALTDNWFKQTNFPASPRAVCSAFSVADSGYVGLGVDNNAVSYNDFYKFFPDSTTGYDELNAQENNIYLYPNPMLFSCNIYLNGMEDNVEPAFCLYDIEGRKVNVEIKKESNYYVLYRNGLNEGAYLLSIKYGNTIINKKVIIIK